jgi:hypothetical protein
VTGFSPKPDTVGSTTKYCRILARPAYSSRTISRTGMDSTVQEKSNDYELPVSPFGGYVRFHAKRTYCTNYPQCAPKHGHYSCYLRLIT